MSQKLISKMLSGKVVYSDKAKAVVLLYFKKAAPLNESSGAALFENGRDVCCSDPD